MVRCGWEVNLGRICLSMKRSRDKKPKEINLAPASSSAAQNGKHQKRFILCSPAISLKTVQLEIILSVFVFLWTKVIFFFLSSWIFQRVFKLPSRIRITWKMYLRIIAQGNCPLSKWLQDLFLDSPNPNVSKWRDRLLDNFLREWFDWTL